MDELILLLQDVCSSCDVQDSRQQQLSQCIATSETVVGGYVSSLIKGKSGDGSSSRKESEESIFTNLTSAASAISNEHIQQLPDLEFECEKITTFNQLKSRTLVVKSDRAENIAIDVNSEKTCTRVFLFDDISRCCMISSDTMSLTCMVCTYGKDIN